MLIINKAGQLFQKVGPASHCHATDDKWRPLMMRFQQFYGLGNQIHPSKLASVPERLYRTRDTESAGVSQIDLIKKMRGVSNREYRAIKSPA